MRRLTCIFLLVSACALVSAAPSYAEGGASIAAAPSIVPGQQEFGNTTNGPGYSDGCQGDYHISWWILPAISGDNVVIDWEEPEEIRHVYSGLEVLAVGTTDFNWPKASTVVVSSLNSNGKAEASFTATSSGNMPVLVTTSTADCASGTPGPYAFTVHVTHALNVALPHVGVLRSKGTLAVRVHNPEGGAINDPSLQVELQIKGHGGWQTIGVAPVADSAALVHFKIPSRLRHQRAALRAIVHGPEYKLTASSHVKVRTL